MTSLFLSCLALLQPYESEISKGVPGNASSFRFDSCGISDVPVGRQVDITATAQARQKVCKWGRCVVVWSYTSGVFATAVVDAGCDLVRVDVSLHPPNLVLDPLVPRVIEGIKRRWPEVQERHPDLCP